MKTTFTILLFFILNFAFAQDLKTIELLPPESKELSDLSFLKKELEAKQLVMLGEQTHEYGNIFEMKARIVEYLHKELGFTTFAMESPMYEIWKMNQKGFSKDGFNDAVFSVWSETSEFQRLVDYLDENKLKVIGFDSQVNDDVNFIEDFFDYCEKQKIELKLDKDDMGITIEAVLNIANFDEDDIKFKAFENEINRIIKQIEKLENNEENYYWKQFTKNLLASSKDAFYVKEFIKSNVNGDKDFNIRDKQMADNLLSYIERNPFEKIICWADNLHLINDNSSVTTPIAKDFIPMGSYIKKELKDKVYSLGTIHSNDSLFLSKVNKWHPTPVKINSFEYDLKQFKKSYLFVSSNQEAMRNPKYSRLLSFVDFLEMRVDQLHDGYIFFTNATIPKLKYEGEVLSKNSLQTEKKSSPINNKNKRSIKSQIWNEQTNEAIPFATVVFKKDNIYRIADENGNFEFPLKKSVLSDISLEISSVGYETKNILLSEIREKVYLKNQFEQLPEVVIQQVLKPKAVLKKAISNLKLNHPTTPFNFDRYSKIIKTKNDETNVDFELLTKDYNRGYLTQFITTQRVEQIKWNLKSVSKQYKSVADFFGFRENPIQYSTILNKRKYKKFELNYVYSDEKESGNWYIIEFKTERNKWSFTNKIYPTKYSGRIYVDKENFAVLKVVENWETLLNRDEILHHLKYEDSAKDAFQLTLKQENTVQFSQVNSDGKYYAVSYFTRSLSEKLTDKNVFENTVTEKYSYANNFETKAVEELKYENQATQNYKLDRVDYDQNFWESFYKTDFYKDQN